MDYQHLLYDKDGKVVTLTLNRPQALNSLSPALEAEVHAALDEADADDEVRAIILTGAGRAFSAGYDISNNPDRPRVDPRSIPIAEHIKRWAKGDLATVNKLMHLWYVGKPIIAALHRSRPAL